MRKGKRREKKEESNGDKQKRRERREKREKRKRERVKKNRGNNLDVIYRHTYLPVALNHYIYPLCSEIHYWGVLTLITAHCMKMFFFFFFF